jgi:regulator of protease activity HflC (stomatin/prohibitin superfamily)
MIAKLKIGCACAFLVCGLTYVLAEKAGIAQKALPLLAIGAISLYLCLLIELIQRFVRITTRILERKNMTRREIIIKDTHRGLWYVDGVLTRVLEAGRYALPRHYDLGFYRNPKVEVVLVDVRERDLTIKGQEILTADKVAIRVSIIVQFRVTDPRAALHHVESYEDRLYSDVQLAARRSLASMTLEEILTNRNRLSEDISRDVTEAATGYGVAILRADVKDLIFPGNLQEVMNRVLTAERLSQAQLVEARTKAQMQRIEADAGLENRQRDAEAALNSLRLRAENEAEMQRLKTQSEIEALQAREQAARAYREHPALLRLQELETLRELAHNANARIYIGFDKHLELNAEESAT